MSSPTSLLTDAFKEMRAYWLANGGGTRAGLIADLVAVLGVTQQKAANWVDAVTQDAFDLGFTDDNTYATFKARLLAIGVQRGNRMTMVIFGDLTGGPLVSDAKDQVVANIDAEIASVNADVALAGAALAELRALPASATRDFDIVSVNAYTLQLQRRLSVLSSDRAAVLAS